MELASELLEVTNEREFEQFLNNVLRTVSQAVGQFIRSDTGRALTRPLTNTARQALPGLGGTMGGWFIPGRSGTIGRGLAQQAGGLLGLEREALSPRTKISRRRVCLFALRARVSEPPRSISDHPAASRCSGSRTGCGATVRTRIDERCRSGREADFDHGSIRPCADPRGGERNGIRDPRRNCNLKGETR